MILHLESVAFHANRCLQSRHDLMGQRPDVEHRLHRIDQFGKTAFHDLAVDMLDLEWESRQALERMQHHEPGAGGQEVCFRHRGAGELQISTPAALDPGVVGKLLAFDPADGMERHGKTVGALIHLETRNLRRGRAPVLVADQEAHRAQHFDAVDPEIAQLSVVEFHRHRSGFQDPADDVRLFRSGQRNRARGFGYCHVPLL